MEKKHCDNEACKDYWSCKYLKHRFGIKECSSYPHIKILVENKYQNEIKIRKELLKQLNKPR